MPPVAGDGTMFPNATSFKRALPKKYHEGFLEHENNGVSALLAPARRCSTHAMDAGSLCTRGEVRYVSSTTLTSRAAERCALWRYWG